MAAARLAGQGGWLKMQAKQAHAACCATQSATYKLLMDNPMGLQQAQPHSQSLLPLPTTLAMRSSSPRIWGRSRAAVAGSTIVNQDVGRLRLGAIL